jgi:hypothetical protein
VKGHQLQIDLWVGLRRASVAYLRGDLRFLPLLLLFLCCCRPVPDTKMTTADGLGVWVGNSGKLRKHISTLDIDNKGNVICINVQYPASRRFLLSGEAV